MADHDSTIAPAEPPVEPALDADAEGRWLSYRELAAIRGISADRAKKVALQQGWRRVPGNDGANRVLVPEAWLRPAKEPATKPTRGRPRAATRVEASDTKELQASFATALIAMRDAHGAEVRALRDQLDLTLAMAGERGKAMAALEVAITKAEASQAALVAELAAIRAAHQEAQDAAAALQAADAARKAQGRWARVRAAWRGR